MGKYSEDSSWSDIIPLPTDEGGPSPLAAIAYSDEYSECMSYLRACMSALEFSPRVLALTEDLISQNPAHYTVWLYRAQCLFALNYDLRKELEWLNDIALQHQKNYQIWHHRQTVVESLGDCEGETEFVERMFERDGKNYHVWSYRQWLAKRFNLWEAGELEFTERMLAKDIMNNSAWNHRWYIVNGREARSTEEGGPVEGVTNKEVREREVEFTKRCIRQVPMNQSPWNYLRGICKKSGTPLAELKDFVMEFADLGKVEQVRSSYALDFLADILAEEKGRKEEARAVLDLLANKYDPIRKNYWEYRKALLVGGEDVVAV